MKKRNILILLGTLVMLAVAGCGVSEEKQKENVTRAPEEQVTQIPEDGAKPTETVKDTNQEDAENVSDGLTVTFKEETEEAKDGDVIYFKSGIYFPVFEGTYGDNMNRFVQSLVEEFRECLPDAKESAYFDYEEAKTNEFGMQIFPEAEELTVSCVWMKEPITVIKAEYYSNTGGAHPYIMNKTYVVDMTDGYKETFERMIEPYGLTTDEVVDFASERFRQEHGEDLFETDDEDALNSWVYMFTQTHQWYFNENGLVLFANPYDIAPYAAGTLECVISYEELEQGLKK